MKNTTSNDTSVKVISDAREEEILSIFRTLHHKLLTVCTEVGEKITFNDDFAKCGAVDYKEIQATTRTLLNAKRKDRNDKRVSGVRTAILGVVDTYMGKARAAKAAIDAMPADVRQFMTFPSMVKIPLSDIRACFPQGESDTQVFADLEYLGYKVTDMTTNGKVLVPFKPEADKVSEDAPKSGEAVKAA